MIIVIMRYNVNNQFIALKWVAKLNGYHSPTRFITTQTFLDVEALLIFDVKSTELRHETVANLIVVMNLVGEW